MNPVQDLPNRIRQFVDIVLQADLHGLAFQHLALCRRRAWFHLHRIDYAHLDSNMQRGLALHDISRPRDSSVEGLMGLAPDRIDWEGHCVFEAKGGAGAADAVSRQGAFYALMLSAAQEHSWSAATHLISAKRDRPITITATLVEEMIVAAESLAVLCREPDVPVVAIIPFCKRCSYRALCDAD